MKMIDTQKISYSDDRGVIIDLLANELINSVTYITCKKGAVRGNHYHKHTYQYNYIISGKLLMVTQMGDGEIIKTVLEKGSLCLTVPMEKHALFALEDTEVLVLTKGPNGGKEYEFDTFSLTEPLIKPIEEMA